MLSCNTLKDKRIESPNCLRVYDSSYKKYVYVYVDKMPEYPGGESKFLNYIFENIKYPEQNIVQPTLHLCFIINKRGNVVHCQIIRKEEGRNTAIENEIIRVINSSTEWKPGACMNKPVQVKKYLTLNINVKW